MRGGAVLALFVVLAACTPAKTPAITHAPAQQARHVFLIVMENHSAEQALSGPFVNSLAAKYGEAGNYHAVSHPSVPNYLALSSGSTWGVTDDSYRILPRRDLGTELSDAGISWRAYMEGLTGAGCIKSPLPYDAGHNPFAFYGGACPSNVVPFDRFGADLQSNTPMFSWITPNRCHDTHDCDVAVGDEWLHQQVNAITSSAAWKSGGVLFITWDEDDENADNQVLTLVIAPAASHHASQRAYTHYSLLATVEDLLGVKRLGEAAQATAMNDLLR